MNSWRKSLLLTLVLAVSGLPMQSDAEADAGPAAAVAPGNPPPPPAAKSPIYFFRQLLAMNLAERKQALADRTPENRRQILAKLRQYEALKPAEQELRLKVTELRWYLLPLMHSPATNRQEQLAGIPAEDRQLVEDRLQLWDIVPPDLQKELLDNEATLRYLCELGSQKPSLANMSAERMKNLEQGLELWRSLPEDQKKMLLARFDQMFGLTQREKEKVLRALSDVEREQIEKTLHRFGALSAAQRSECIRSFEKFTNLSIEERDQFLRNADRWKLMSPEERREWKEVVQKLTPQPPLPPGFGQPPAPPGLPVRRPAPLATNGN